MKEKRKYIRIEPSSPIKVKFKVVHAKKHRRVFKKGSRSPKNISGGGIFLELPFMKPEVIKDLLSGKNKIALELKIPHYTPSIKILGKAVWMDKKEIAEHKSMECGIGIRFEEIKEEDRERLLQYMLELILQ